MHHLPQNMQGDPIVNVQTIIYNSYDIQWKLSADQAKSLEIKSARSNLKY